MKQIVDRVPSGVISVATVARATYDHGKLGIVIYCRKSTGDKSRSTYALLTRTERTWSFVDMQGGSSTPTYRGPHPEACITAVIKSGRDVYLFDSWAEFAKWSNT